MIAIRTVWATGLAVALAFGAGAQDAPKPDYTKNPGYVAVDTEALFGGEQPPVSIFLEKPILQMLGGMLMEEDPEAAAMVKSLELVRLFIFEGTPEKAAAIGKTFAELTAKLESEGWSKAIAVEEEDERFTILVKLKGDACEGMAIAHHSADGEAIFGNVVGDFDPAKLGEILAGGLFHGGDFGQMFGGFMGGHDFDKHHDGDYDKDEDVDVHVHEHETVHEKVDVKETETP